MSTTAPSSDRSIRRHGSATLRALRSEWIILSRPRLWAGVLTAAAILSAASTWIVFATLPDAGMPELGLTRGTATEPGGATAAAVSISGYASVLIVASFAAAAGNDFTRGRYRAALTRLPHRAALLTGQLTARLGIAAVTILVVLAAGAAAATALAGGYDVSTDRWFTVDGLAVAAEDSARIAVFVAAYALIGTAVAAVIRSTPIALGVLLLWFGPIENVFGDGRAWAQQSFPGLVLRALLQPEAPGAVSTPAALATIALYAAAALAVLGVALGRRDVTA